MAEEVHSCKRICIAPGENGKQFKNILVRLSKFLYYVKIYFQIVRKSFEKHK